MQIERFKRGEFIDVGGVRLGVPQRLALEIPDSHIVRWSGKVALVIRREANPSIDSAPLTAENSQ